MNNLNSLNKLLEKEPSYRIKQIKKIIFHDLIENWEDATTLPLKLRDILNKHFTLEINGKIISSKNTSKAVITLNDNIKIETVLMKHKDKRNTVCVSSQAGCPLGCNFCATGMLKFKRNLTSWEILEQVLFWARHLKQTMEKITNIVFMGMGEPFLNYDNVINAIRLINNKDIFNIGARNISISTVGIIKGIKKFAKEDLNINLAISLHAPDDLLRYKIMPVNKKYNIKNIFQALNEYIKIKNRRVMLEYLMIKDFNDSAEHARQLVKLIQRPAFAKASAEASLGGSWHLYFVNLITYNPTGNFGPSPQWKIRKFMDILKKEGINVTQRYKFGNNINAACGQLIYKSS